MYCRVDTYTNATEDKTYDHFLNYVNEHGQRSDYVELDQWFLNHDNVSLKIQPRWVSK